MTENRPVGENVELFEAYSVEEIRERRELLSTNGFSCPSISDCSSSCSST